VVELPLRTSRANAVRRAPDASCTESVLKEITIS
jgi:hypothetical protein